MAFDPAAWTEGAVALKSAFDAFRSAIGLAKEIRGGGTSAQQETVIKALEQASATASIAEAQIAKALGYELCKCEFPPTPMLTVGYMGRGPKEKLGPVYECPKCGLNTASPHMYERTAPPRDAK